MELFPFLCSAGGSGAARWRQASGLSKVAQAAVRRAAQSLVRTTSLTSLARWVLYTCILPAAAAALLWYRAVLGWLVAAA